jgi:hypothetical protein
LQATSSKQFDPIYRAHQPPAVRELMDIEDYVARQSRGIELATKGFLIDREIMVYGWDSFLEMQQRLIFGFSWVPSLLGQQVTIAPGLGSLPGLPAYDPKAMPRDGIKCSLEIGDGSTTFGDYPPLDPPPQPATPPSTSAVGISEGFGFTGMGTMEFFSAISSIVIALGLHDGSTYDEPDQPGRPSRGKFLLHESPNAFAEGSGQMAMWFTRIP